MKTKIYIIKPVLPAPYDKYIGPAAAESNMDLDAWWITLGIVAWGLRDGEEYVAAITRLCENDYDKFLNNGSIIPNEK